MTAELLPLASALTCPSVLHAGVLEGLSTTLCHLVETGLPDLHGIRAWLTLCPWNTLACFLTEASLSHPKAHLLLLNIIPKGEGSTSVSLI